MVRDIFISFSDDHIRFMYLYLLNYEFEVLNASIPRRKKKKNNMKIIRSDTSKEYYSRYTQKEND
jgi:hypothetical protein